MSLQVGMPIAYRDNSGNIFPGFISGNNGSPGNYMIYWDTNQSGAVSSFKGPVSLPTRDDTLSSNNTWAPVLITASAAFTGV